MEVELWNQSYEWLTNVTWQRAISLVLGGFAEIHEADDVRTVRSQHLVMPLPRVIRMLRYIHLKREYRPRVNDDAEQAASKSGILARDRHTCAYCGAAKSGTVDHVLPRSQGGKSSWTNLVACCVPCNSFKRDRTPKEAGMRLLWEPRVPDRKAGKQRKIWKSLRT